MNFTLSDLVPPLRWSDPRQIAELSGETAVPAAWWRTLPLGHVMAALGANRVCDILTSMAKEHWPSAALGDILPPLHVIEPDERSWPPAARAVLRRAGSWPAFLALSVHDLTAAPPAGPDQAATVVRATFWEVIGHLPAGTAEPDRPDISPAVGTIADWLPADAPPAVRAAMNQLSVLSGRAAQPVAPDRAQPTSHLPAERLPKKVAGFPAPRGGSLAKLINAAFADLDDLEWQVAQHCLFSESPTDPAQIARLFATDAAHVMAVEDRLRDRVIDWAQSDAAAPVAAHLRKLADDLEVAVPISRLASAASWHEEELQAIGVPVWRFLLPLLPHSIVGDWLVNGDIDDLDPATRARITGRPEVEEPPAPRPSRQGFVGIRRLIAKDVEEAGGEVPLDDLCDRLSDRFGVSPTLVARYAKGDGFVFENGTVRVAGEERAADPPPAEPASPSNPDPAALEVATTGRCFQGKKGGRWWYRLDVTSELLEGADAELPAGFATYLGVAPDTDRTGRSPSGEVEFTWTDGPVMRPVLPLLERLGAGDGDHVFITLTKGGDLIFRHLRAPGEAVEGIGLAVRLAGYTAPVETDEDAVRLIGARIDLPEKPDRDELVERLTERGDHDILEALG